MSHLDGRNSRISFGSKRLVSPLFLLIRCLLFGHFGHLKRFLGKRNHSMSTARKPRTQTHRTRTTHTSQMANRQPNAARDAALSACFIQLTRISLSSIRVLTAASCHPSAAIRELGSTFLFIYFFFLLLLLPWGYRETHQAAIDKNRVTSSVSRTIFPLPPPFSFFFPSLLFSLSHLLVSFSLVLSIIPIVLLQASSRRDYTTTHIHSVRDVSSTPPTPRIGENR